MINFVLSGLPRSGTTVVSGALIGHRDIQFYGELFNDLIGVRRNEAARITLGAGWQVARAPSKAVRACAADESGYRYLEQFYALPTPARALGFKLLYDQAASGPNSEAWRYLAEHPAVRIIRTRRDNLLDIVCSYARARLTRRWHSADVALESPRFVLPAHECAALFERFSHVPRAFAGIEATHHVLDIDYAQIEADFAASMTRVFGFLEVDDKIRAEPRLRKIARSTPAEEIVNYAELKQHFAPSEFARFFVY